MRRKTLWFTALFSAICLEGLGRKYIPAVPAFVFYLLKDAVLVFGVLKMRPPRGVMATVRRLYRGFEFALVAALGWTFLELFNPDHGSAVLGALGFRAYWLWWLAPPVIAGILMDPKEKAKAIRALLVMAVGIAVLAAVQFASPADSAINLYSIQDGQEVYAADAATVASTGKARVAATFTFLSGFVDFTLLVPALLLSVGLEARDSRLRRNALIATMCCAAVIPMSGSRGSIVIGAAVLLITAWTAGLFFTRIGRRVLIAACVAGLASAFVFPEAMSGVQSRFENVEETSGRFRELFTVLPPVAMATYEYPMLGIGTGMQQNARVQLKVYTSWESEAEAHRYLIELGPIGYLLVWTARLGLMVALLRAYAILKRADRRGAAGAALSYAALTMLGNLVFDHVWQALYFLGCGFILSEVVAVLRAAQPAPAPATASPGPPPVARPTVVAAEPS